MTSFNPIQMMGQMMNNNPFTQMMNQMSKMGQSSNQNLNALFGSQSSPFSQGQSQVPYFNKEQFKSFLPNINNNMMQQLVQKARAQGISDSDIEAGLNFINRLKGSN